MKPKILVMRGKIDPREYAVPAQDHRGHGAQVAFRVTPEMKRAISIVLAKAPELGWSTDSDFWRWAGRNALQSLEPKIKDGEFSNMLRQEEVIRQGFMNQQRLADFEKTFEQAKQTVQILQVNNPREIIPALMRTQKLIEEMDNDSWRDAWQKRFDKEFGDLLRRKK